MQEFNGENHTTLLIVQELNEENHTALPTVQELDGENHTDLPTDMPASEQKKSDLELALEQNTFYIVDENVEILACPEALAEFNLRK